MASRPRNHSTAKRYERLKLLAAGLDFATYIAVPLAVLLTGLSTYIRDVVYSDISANPVLGASVYAFFAVLFMAVLTFPLSWWSGFRLEHRFGLSRETFGRWLLDWFKGLGVRIIFTVVAVAGLYALLAYTGPYWWVWATVALCIVSLLMVVIFPVLLMPIFFKFEPLPDGDLRDTLLELAARVGTAVRGAYIWKLGEQTVKANAALAGWGRTRRIIVSDTLLDNFDDDEVEVVIAHELGHQVNRDIPRMFVVQVVVIAIGMFVTDLALRQWSDSFGLNGALDDIANLPLLALVLTAVTAVSVPLVNTYSRRRETAADDFALEVTGKRAEFVSAMEKLGEVNLAVRDPHWLQETLLHSHPSIGRRVRRAQEDSHARSKSEHVVEC